MTVSTKEIRVSTVTGLVSLIAVLLTIGIYFGVSNQTNAQQTQDINDIKASMITKREFDEFKKDNLRSLENIQGLLQTYLSQTSK